MVQLKTYSSAPIWASRQRTFVAALDQVTRVLRAQAANILRLLILALVGLLFVLVGLMILTGRVEIGGPLEPGFHQKLLAHIDPAYRAWGVRAAGNAHQVDAAVKAKVVSLVL